MKRGVKVVLTCDCGCGETFSRYRNKVSPGNNYLNRQHAGAHEKRRHLEALCGPYLNLVTDYLGGAAAQRYSDLRTVRNRLCPFFHYLCLRDIASISDVSSATITEFKVWGREHGYLSAATDISALSTFFQWLIHEEYFGDQNPVIPSIHGKSDKARTGRPYTQSEMTQMRDWLDQRGNPRLRAFFEIAAESGMRNAEICRLRLRDLEINTKTLQVRLPNKGRREREAFFFGRASSMLIEWLSVRDVGCGHDFIFHNYLGDPLTKASVQLEFRRVLCKTYPNRVENETGLDSFSVHRLRHTLASTLASNGADANTLMACLGWVSLSSMEGYIRIDEETKVRGFVVAAERVEHQLREEATKKTLSMEEFLEMACEEAA